MDHCYQESEKTPLQPHTVPTQQLPSTPSEPALRQSRPKTRLPRLPPLPAEDYKLAIRPHGGLNLSKVSPKTLLLAVVHAANIRSEKPDIKLRVDENQNVLTISTSSEHIAMALGQITKITVHAATYDITSYGIAPDNSCKGVVNGIGHEITPDNFLIEVEVPGYEVLTCRRLGNSGAMVLTFCGKRVPFFVNAYGQALRCYLYKRTIPHSRKCNKTGHRGDVCPQPPDTPKCRVCGDSLSPNNHECRPSCMLCGGDQPTAAKPCPKRFLPPVDRRKLPRSATPTKKAQSPSPSPGRQSSASGCAARRRSHSRDKSGPKRGNSSPRSGFAGQPGSQGWHTDGTTHHRGQQSGSHKKAQTVSWAGQFPPLPPSPHQSHSLTQTSTQERTPQPTPPRLPQPMSVDTQLHPDMSSTTARSEYCTREALNEMATSLRNEFATMMQVEMQKMKDSIMAELTAPLQQLIQQALQPAVQQIVTDVKQQISAALGQLDISPSAPKRTTSPTRETQRLHPYIRPSRFLSPSRKTVPTAAAAANPLPTTLHQDLTQSEVPPCSTEAPLLHDHGEKPQVNA
ncbi:hypothetical protein HPB51_023959 [Rhipicephalus microplus]|uniref:Uncharacterized protein n=1 Tax=Rhipicephalus microplus TaxID=6941 RepID=A0A9J6DR58_RHIMP|nr:hypothetical protein HPB51_023959 [Rhipicephalus microplus]